MAESFVGSIVSIDCGDVLGTYQGLVSAVNSGTQMLTITQAFRNGIKCTVPQITLDAGDICDLKIISKTSEKNNIPSLREMCMTTTPPRKSSSNNQHDKVTRRGSSGVKHSAAGTNGPNNSHHRNVTHGLRQSPQDNSRQSPLDQAHQKSAKCPLQSPYKVRSHTPPSQRNGTAVYQNGYPQNGYSNMPDGEEVRQRTNSMDCAKISRRASNPRKIEGRNNRGNLSRQDSNSAPTVDTFLNEDFDFEKNLALFDKQAVFEEIERELGTQGYPTAVAVDPYSEAKYKCDENVLQSAPVIYRQIKVPDSAKEYVTDSGLVVPSLSYELRERLLSSAERLGLTVERQLENIGRSTAEMVMQLCGGSHRLTPKNAHQRPNVVVLCGPRLTGAMGVNCARHLVQHDVNVRLFHAPSTSVDIHLSRELSLYDLAEGHRISSVKDLPTRPVDIIVSALEGPGDHLDVSEVWYGAAVRWASTNKAHVIAINPPAEGSLMDSKWAIQLALPLAMSEKYSQLYLCDVGVPRRAFKEVGITYRSPFGHKFIVALHANKDTS